MRHEDFFTAPRGKRGGGPGPGRRRHGGFDPAGDEFGPGGHGRGRGFGPRGGGRRGRGPGRGGRPRGDVRAAILTLLAEQPRHGYDLIRAIEERSGGAWTPSPGSIYPTLQALEDEGLVAIDTVEGRKTASLTDAGREWVAEHGDAHQEIFHAEGGREAAGEIRKEMMALRDAAIHVSRLRDNPDVARRAVTVLTEARRELYNLLAESEA